MAWYITEIINCESLPLQSIPDLALKQKALNSTPNSNSACCLWYAFIQWLLSSSQAFCRAVFWIRLFIIWVGLGKVSF